MGFFGKLFGKQPKPQKAPQAAASPTPPSKKPPDLITVFDGYGREFRITREQWRTSVLPGSLSKAWNNPDELYSIIASALNDGFRSEVMKAAEQLYKIDRSGSRGACLWGVMLMEGGRLHEAEKVFQRCLSKHGEDGWILLNLAKVHSKRGQEAKVESVLWHALETNPNMDNAVGWYYARHKERAGEQGGLDAWRKIANLPGSWRAQLWLARAELDSKGLPKALLLYQEALAHAVKPAPADLLMQMSGDLGKHGHLSEALALTERQFDVGAHGLLVGNNLVKAHFDLGQLDEAQLVLDQLYSAKRPDWKESLAFWDTQIAKARVTETKVKQDDPLSMVFLTIDGPIWSPKELLRAKLFPIKPSDAPVIYLLGSSADKKDGNQDAMLQMADAPGRLSRAIPLFLAEQIEHGTDARAAILIPWISLGRGSFVLCGKPWSDEDAAGYAMQGELKGDYVVAAHIVAEEPWKLELRLIRCIDGSCLGRLNTIFDWQRPNAISGMGSLLASLLSEHGVAKRKPFPHDYCVPQGADFPYYLLRLEQLLAVRCAAMSEANSGFLSGAREIVDGNLQLCLTCPENATTRLLLAKTLLSMRKVNRDAVMEFSDKVRLLQKEKPLAGPANGVVQQLIDEALAS